MLFIEQIPQDRCTFCGLKKPNLMTFSASFTFLNLIEEGHAHPLLERHGYGCEKCITEYAGEFRTRFVNFAVIGRSSEEE